MGAIAPGGTVVFNKPLLAQLTVEHKLIDSVVVTEQKELLRRERLYKGTRSFPNVSDKTIILVDDGIATGSTMRAAVLALKEYKPACIVIVVPVAAGSTCEELKPLVDKIVCPLRPVPFDAVGLWYEEFSQTSDEEVMELMKHSNSTRNNFR